MGNELLTGSGRSLAARVGGCQECGGAALWLDTARPGRLDS